MKLTKIIGMFCLFTLIVHCKKSSPSEKIENLPFYQDASFTPFWLSKHPDSIANFHKIAPFRLVNQLGDTISEKTFEGKIYVADFFFTSCPGICPRMTSNMSLIQKAFKDDNTVLLLSHSVTPELDSVTILKTYAETHGVFDNKWHLVTGERKTIYDLGRKSYFVEENLGENPAENDFLHTENFVLIDQNLHIRGIYNGLNKTEIKLLINDIKTLKKE